MLAHRGGYEAARQIEIWMMYYNEERPQFQLCGDRTPMEEHNLRLAA